MDYAQLITKVEAHSRSTWRSFWWTLASAVTIVGGAILSFGFFISLPFNEPITWPGIGTGVSTSATAFGVQPGDALLCLALVAGVLVATVWAPAQASGSRGTEPSADAVDAWRADSLRTILMLCGVAAVSFPLAAAAFLLREVATGANVLPEVGTFLAVCSLGLILAWLSCTRVPSQAEATFDAQRSVVHARAASERDASAWIARRRVDRIRPATVFRTAIIIAGPAVPWMIVESLAPYAWPFGMFACLIAPVCAAGIAPFKLFRSTANRSVAIFLCALGSLGIAVAGLLTLSVIVSWPSFIGTGVALVSAVAAARGVAAGRQQKVLFVKDAQIVFWSIVNLRLLQNLRSTRRHRDRMVERLEGLESSTGRSGEERAETTIQVV